MEEGKMIKEENGLQRRYDIDSAVKAVIRSDDMRTAMFLLCELMYQRGRADGAVEARKEG